MKTLVNLIVLLSFGITAAQAQIVQSNFSEWENNLPVGWMGSRGNISPDSIQQVNTGVQFGSSAVRLRNADSQHRRFNTTSVAVEAGVAYEIKYWVRGRGDIRFGVYDSATAGMGFRYASYININSTNWVQHTQTITPELTYNKAQFILSVRNTVPANGHIEVDSVVISSAGAPVFTSIYDIQFTTASDGSSPLAGTSVSTGGIVTATHSTGFFVQSGTGPWTGIFVFNNVLNPNRGDSVTFNANVVEFNGNTQLTGVSNFIVRASGLTVAPVLVSTAQAGTEPYESVLVRVENAVCTNPNAGFGEWTISNGTPINVDDLLFVFVPQQGASYNVTGPVYFSFGTFKILPRNAADIELVTGLQNLSTAATLASLWPNPAVDYLHIKVAERIVIMQLHDLQGRLIIEQHLTQGTHTIAVHTLPKGLYSLSLGTGSIVQQSKVIIAH